MPTEMPALAAIPTFGPAVPQKKKLSKAELEEIKALGQPKWEYSEPVDWCKYRKIVMEESNAWAQKSDLEGMYKTPKDMQKQVAYNLSDIMMVVMVDSGEREAVLVGKYSVWGFAYDDFFDPDDDKFDKDAAVRVILDLNLMLVCYFPDDPRFRANLAMSLEGEDAAKRNEILKYVDVEAAVARQFPGTAYDIKQSHPLVRGFGELWTEVAESVPRQYLLRWSIDHQRYVNSFLREVNIRNASYEAPSLQDYILLRRETIAIAAYSVLLLDLLHMGCFRFEIHNVC